MLSRSIRLRTFSQFVPKHSPPDSYDLKNFERFLNEYKNILILTGAGISTESGIPDYRSEDVGVFARTNYRPIQYSDFLKNPEARQRFWARNFIGWPKFSKLQPNRAHIFIAQLQTFREKVSGLVTQNVDGLHTKAGSREVEELHGNAFWVRCQKCGDTFSRFEFQTELQNRNSLINCASGELRPDGDVEVNEEDIKNFVVPDCKKCGGILKPTVVFFGENVPEKLVKKVENLVEKSDALLILGTSLSTLSSSRIVEQAYDLCKFICVVNIGPTRCDKLVDLQIPAKINDVLPSFRV